MAKTKETVAKTKEIMSVEEAARRLGAKVSEVVSVQAHSHGTVVVMAAGTKTLLCDVPDGEGKTGIMLLERPDAERLRDDAKAPPMGPVFAPSGPKEEAELEHIDEPTGIGDGEHVTEPTAVEKKAAK